MCYNVKKMCGKSSPAGRGVICEVTPTRLPLKDITKPTPIYRGISVITPLPLGEGKGEGPLTHMGISVITPLPCGGGEGGGATELLKTYSRQSTQSVTAVVDNIIELGNIFTK